MARPVRVFPFLMAFGVMVVVAVAFYFVRQFQPSRAPAVPPSDATTVTNSPADPNEKMLELLRSGSVTAKGALASTSDAYKEAKIQKSKAKPDVAEALAEVSSQIDDAGRALAQNIGDPPSKADIERRFAAFDDRRSRAISRANEALSSLREASGIVASLAEDHPELVPLKRMLYLAREDATNTVISFGGEPTGG